MSHALIIEDNLIISQVIEKRLKDIGFNSFDHAWTEQQAVEFAAKKFPDLIIVGDDLECGSGIAAARTISETGAVAIVLVTAEWASSYRALPKDASLQGPHPLDQIATVVRAARTDSFVLDCP